MKKILFIIGSLRAKSFNRQVANVAKEMIGNRAEVQELDYSDLPLLSQDIEQPELAVVARIRNRYPSLRFIVPWLSLNFK